MQQFLKTIAVFAFIFVVYLGATMVINKLIISKTHAPLNDKTVLILGDSHTRLSLNPAIFKSAANISQDAEPYAVTYWKLKSILETAKPDTVIIGFSCHNISAFNDYKFIDKNWSTELFKRTYSIQELDGLAEYNVEVNFKEFYWTYFQYMYLYPKLHYKQYLGAYSNTKASNLGDATHIVGRHYTREGKPLSVSEGSIAYLNKIIELCKEKGVTPVLVATPLHAAYIKEIPTDIEARYDIEKARLQSEGVIILDHTSEAYEDASFLDFDHLNEIGAAKFSKTIAGEL